MSGTRNCIPEYRRFFAAEIPEKEDLLRLYDDSALPPREAVQHSDRH